jgi:hypothetical protein
MFGSSKISQSLLAAVAALLVSSVAVGAAVAPAQALASPGTRTIQANLNA